MKTTKTTRYRYDDEAVIDHVRSAKDSVTTRAQVSAVLGPEVQEYRLTDVETLRKAMEQMHNCKGGKIHVKELSRSGLGSSLLFQCSLCAHKVHMDPAKEMPGIVKTFDINRRTVYASGELGLGRESLATLCEIMNLPSPVYDNCYQDHIKSIHSTTKVVLEKKLREQNSDIEADSVIDVSVSFDRTWSKRGFTANFGIAFAISSDTGEVLDYCVLSKTCDFCKQSEKLKKQDPEKFEEWKKIHEERGECQKNFSGSSPVVEPAAAEIIWSHSIGKYNLRYTDMVCDGDSKSYNTVWDIYGLCDDCAKFESQDKKSPAYKEWLETDECKEWEKKHFMGEADCVRVNKLDCVGHVQKRMGKNLIELVKKSKKLSYGKAVGSRADRLTRPTIDLLQNYYGNAIQRNVDRKAKSRQQIDTVIKNMQQDIKALLYHSVKLEDTEERHQFCPKGDQSWCRYQKDKALGLDT